MAQIDVQVVVRMGEGHGVEIAERLRTALSRSIIAEGNKGTLRSISDRGTSAPGRANSRLRFTGNRSDAIIRRSPWGYSSAGRALAWHARGQRFDPAYLHHRSDRGALEEPSATASRSLSSRGPGHRPFTAVTRVRIPLGTPYKSNCYVGFNMAIR